MIIQYIYNTVSKSPDIGTIFSSITAVIALLFSFYGLYLQRKHNRLSVKPNANFIFGNYENDIYVKLRNTGLGPLVIVKNSITFEGKNYTAIIETLDEKLLEIVYTDFCESIDSRTLPPGDEIFLIRYQTHDRKDAKNIKLLRKHLSKLVFNIEYKDFYNKKYPVSCRDGTWFSGNVIS